MKNTRVAVIGGGVAGLLAALDLARAGCQPILFEAAPEIGGRAQTRTFQGLDFNQGPHALYLRGRFHDAVASFGIEVPGGSPNLAAGLALWGEAASPLPIRLTGAAPAAPLDEASTAQLAAFYGRVASGDYDGRGQSLRSVTGSLHPDVRAVIEALVRLSTYTHAPEQIDAKAALDQLRLSFGGVCYVDGGWRTLVAALEAAARSAGVSIRREHRALALTPQTPHWRIEIAGQPAEEVSAVVLALPPGEALQLCSRSPDLARAVKDASPVRLMCLDLGLRSLPNAGADFALGMDEPVYVSVHSAAARLAPGGGAMVHVARYLRPQEAPDPGHFPQLETLMDRLQPGWREREVHRQRLVAIAVTNDFPRCGNQGRRAPETLADSPGIFLAGDWVGDEGMLVDASAASARKAARHALQRLAEI